MAVMAYGFMQFLMWGNFAFQVTYYQWKALGWGLTLEDHLDWGAICNTLENYHCSEKQFEKVLARWPRHQGATANLAMVLSRQGRWEEAILRYEDYFNRGGEALDVMAWYARSLVQIQDRELALIWYYRALSQEPEEALSATANEVVDLLLELEQPEEALSLIGALTQGNPDNSFFWASKMDGLLAYVQSVGGRQPASGAERSMRLPSLDGRSHYVPLSLAGRPKVDFFLLDRQGILERSNLAVTLPLAWVDSSVAPSASPGDLIQLPSAQLGPWALGSLRAEICENCVARINPRAIGQFPLKFLGPDGLEN